MILPGQKKLFALTALGLMIFVLFVWFFIWPLINKIRTISQEYFFNQGILLGLSKRSLAAKDLEASYKEKRDDLSKIERAFLPREETVGFITTLESIAAQTNNIFEIQFSQPAAKDLKEKVSFLNFRISLKGGFNDLISFIAHLENNPYPPYRLIDLEDLNIRRLAENDSTVSDAGLTAGNIQSVLNIKVYTE